MPLMQEWPPCELDAGGQASSNVELSNKRSSWRFSFREHGLRPRRTIAQIFVQQQIEVGEMAREHQTTNLGVRSSNLFGRANNIKDLTKIGLGPKITSG